MVRHIKTALILVFMLAAFILTAKYGLYMATAFSLPAMLLWAFLHQYLQRWEYRELLKQYAVMIENIYEHSHYPGDREVREALDELGERGLPEYTHIVVDFGGRIGGIVPLRQPTATGTRPSSAVFAASITFALIMICAMKTKSRMDIRMGLL